jgi:hypothetical protein
MIVNSPFIGRFHPFHPLKAALGGGKVLVVKIFTVLNAAATKFLCPYDVLNEAASSFTVSATVLNEAGTPFVVT